MVDQVKFLIVERNGTELDDPEEYSFRANLCPVSSPEFAAQDVEAALVELSQRPSGGFGKRFVETDVIISASEEMIVSDFVEIKPTGCLTINGMFTILNY